MFMQILKAESEEEARKIVSADDFEGWSEVDKRYLEFKGYDKSFIDLTYSRERVKMYNIYYKGDICGNPRTYMGTTNNFKKWLEQHNKNRESGTEELSHEFELEKVKESEL
jgi:hypothetical protein